ncbi:nitrate reductase molybdenum cofactor assembly chaperone [Mycobacterium shinjukuense]|uniref:Nitrate reductase molybdenum cofactor assembly chaperone n=1 Tax=Mycobacterium shinjukuense TaxID=398694 RepID=A0A7I7MT02_9MYCO|nr:nitrate reductase molybdenum cofactor assembly chaperone [Mycobacterium shinjukuense]MCV6984971.1 nitrate reductase molybdenum cofactor assembly chaperone [Mycobacterium shinjukuense]ORB69371.1 nitrate reductase molybdenum cofactor assembly chaperone [Mycobacterium shinjukuense]BBX74932.1 nitrate reductase molybdenum cofactor assembly chaperone [Mycobacterium shinjukuense]
MRSRSRSSTVLQDRLAWQCASLLLSYPDTARLDTAERLLAHAEGIAAELLSRTAFELRRLDPLRAAQDYVQTFDMCRRTTMYLTYWTAGDTRNRGAAMLAFAAAYRAGGVAPPRSEAPDYLPVVLEFAATVDPDRGRRLLVEHRVAVDVLRDALTEAASPYAHAVGAVSATLPPATHADLQRARRLAAAGAPAEAVGLQPLTLSVPPRRNPGGD